MAERVDGDALMHAASDGACEAAAGAGIQGRGQAPGRGGDLAAPGSHAAADGGPGQIRGLREEPGQRGTPSTSRAQALLDARNAAIQRSLSDHAERVEKRRQQAAPQEAKVTAVDRMDALRRRLADRVARRRSGEDISRGGDTEQGRDVGGAGSQCGTERTRGEGERDAQTANPNPTKEVVNIHCEERGEVVTSSASTAGASTAAGEAASYAAWHGRDQLVSLEGEG